MWSFVNAWLVLQQLHNSFRSAGVLGHLLVDLVKGFKSTDDRRAGDP
jgi:hypothetical protein